MRRLVLPLSLALAAAVLAAPAVADTRVSTGTTSTSTPDALPVGATVTSDELVVVTAPDDPGAGGSVDVATGPVTVAPRGVPDPTATQPAEQDDKGKEKDKEKDKDERRDRPTR